MWILYVLIILAVIVFFTATYLCYRICFYSPNKEKYRDRPFSQSMDPFLEKLNEWFNRTRALPCEDVWITSFDNLRLHAKYFECPTFNGTVEIMVHGYRGNGERDLCGGVMRAFKLNHNVLMVDQRGCGISEGKVISFGIKEQNDCLKWAQYVNARFNGNVKIILTGISMGAATVLLTSALNLPKSVAGIIADCGYSSTEKIIRHVLTKTPFPRRLTFFLVRLGGILFGRVDICSEKASPEKALEKCNIPVFLIHGEEDKFVPCYMSEENYKAIKSKKLLITVPQAKHGMAYLFAQDKYVSSLKEFFYNE